MMPARSLLMVAAAAVVGGGVMWLFFDAEAGLWTAAFLAFLWGIVLATAHGLMGHRARLGSVPLQFGVGVALPVGLGLAGIQVIALLLFVSAHDALTLALLLGSAGVLVAYCAWFWTARMARDIRAVRDAVSAIGAGETRPRLSFGTRDELAELADAVNHMGDRLARAEQERDEMDRSRRELIAAISHDLRTPLSSVRLLVDGARDGIDDAGTLERLSFHVHSLETLIDDLFELSRIEAGDVEWPMEAIELDELIQEALEGMRPRARSKQVTLTFAERAARRPVRGNPEKLQRVLFNLLENAIHHVPARGEVSVSTRTADGEVVAEVSDSGGGIDVDDRDRVFEPFYRGGTESARPRDGAGLGLPICRAILEAHEGRIWLADVPSGVVIRFALPVVESVREKDPSDG